MWLAIIAASLAGIMFIVSLLSLSIATSEYCHSDDFNTTAVDYYYRLPRNDTHRGDYFHVKCSGSYKVSYRECLAALAERLV